MNTSTDTPTSKSFEEIQKDLLDRARKASACSDQYRRAVQAKNEEELLQVIYSNLSWCLSNGMLDHEFFSHFNQELYLKSGIANTGKENTGFSNSGDSNSGDSNSGYRNSGDSNSGSWNSGDSNSGDSNSGSWNSGDRNSGDSNSGYRNSGDSNSGDSNSGDSNSGSWNSGDRNSGDSNSGYRNSGDSNSGSWNSGDSNSGDSNSGSWNSGDRNSGDSNSGYRNSGAFCSAENPCIRLFDKETNIPVKEWERSEACQILNGLDPTIWVPSSLMTEEEKAAHPKHETPGGYLKTITLKEAWANLWGNLTDQKKALFPALPNFDSEKFESITGIKI